MKRAAEKQLIKDQEDDGDDEVEETAGTGFKMADESVLARRQIRALPRRSLAGAATSAPPPPSASTSESAPAGKFTGFSGFGTATPPSSSFSFSTPSQPPGAPKIAPAVPAASPFSSLGSSGTNSSQPTPLFGGPSVSSNASAATKTFASIVSSSSGAAAAPSAVDEDLSEVEYYKALRGLNVSFLSAVSKAIESDPFVDVADLLERYKTLRVTVESDFDGKSSKSASKAEASSTSAPYKVAEAPKLPSFSLPAPPTSFAGFAPPTPSAQAPPGAAAGGFFPKVDSKPAPLGSAFTFAPTKPTESSSTPEAPKASFSFGSSSTQEAPKSSFSFGSSSSSTTSNSSAFKFGASSSGSSLFGSSAPTTSSSAPSLVESSAPSTSIFGSSSTAPSLFGGSSAGSRDADKEKDADKPAATPLFGSGTSSSSSLFGAKTDTTTPEKEKSSSPAPFSFGSASPGKPSLFGGPSAFGPAKAGSIGNPVGFGFGSPPKTPDATTDGPIKSLPFSFVPAPVSKPAAEGAEDEKKDEDGAAPSGEQRPPLLATSSAHDQEGEGEEGEETVHEIRSKVYKMTKDKDGKAQWGDMGVGVLRLKKHKETGARRVLLRNSGTGKITINFRIHSGMNATVADKVVSLMGHEEGASIPYRIRMKTADQAKDLKAALDREIEFVKSKTDS